MLHHRITILTICIFISNAYSDTNYRLNTPIEPISYAIEITPYFDTGDANAFTYDGDVSITFTTKNSTNQIKLHSEDLIFEAANITVQNGGTVLQLNNTNSLQFDTSYTFAYINLQNDLQVGVEYTLTILYRGPIRTDLNGFYRNYYMENGVKKWLGATQMESTHARKVFPCFDEPALKATFSLTINRPASFKPSLANTKMLSSTSLTNNYVKEEFYPTPRMPTYLVAFVISEFDAARVHTNGSEEFGVYTRPDAVNQTDYTFEFGLKVVKALGEYFGIDYYSTNSHLKLDHVALLDFRAGAMENWGLVTYRESLFLYVPEDSTPYYKYRVAQILAHETAHMWFGNLVTCHWWSNTWLNEGFANYFQDYITSLIEPEVGSGNILVTGSVYAAYEADDSATSVPITNNDVNSPEEISGHFGTISYQKAGSVIRMMHHWIGDEAFKIGLNSYLSKNQFSSGYPEYLYEGLNTGVSSTNSLADYSEATVAEVMNSWITQAGHPILHVNIDYENDTVTLTQKRFYINSTFSTNEIYHIPITFTTGMSPEFTNTKPAFIMDKESHTYTISNISRTHSWVIFNIQETGFYRVNYDDHAWQIISSALKSSQRGTIHHLNRAKIVNDLFAFLYADEVSFDRVYDVLEFLSEETDYSVWYAAIRGINKIWNSYLGSDVSAEISSYAQHLLQNAIDKLGYSVRADDDFETLRNRMQVLEFACKVGHQDCIDNAVSMFKQLKDDGIEIPPSFRPVAYCNGLRYGNGEDYQFLWKRMSTTNVANEARTIGEILGCTSDEASLKHYLTSMLEVNSPIKTQDLTMPLSSILSNYYNVQFVVNELKENYTSWSSIYPDMETIVSTVASALHSTEDFNEFESFLSSCTQCTENVLTTARNSLTQSRAKTTWADNHRQDILETLKSSALTLLPCLQLLILGLCTLILN